MCKSHIIEEIYEKCEVDSGNSSGSGNSSCDEIDVESIDSDRKFENSRNFEKSRDSNPIGSTGSTSDGDSIHSSSTENRSENRLDPVRSSPSHSFSISNLLKDERSYQATQASSIFQAAHSLGNPFGTPSFFQHHGIWNPIIFSPSFVRISI